MKGVNELLKIFDIFSALCMIYYVIIGLFIFKKIKKIDKYIPNKKLAVLVPARNEASVIGNLLDSLNNQNYPKYLYDVWVLPNNCNDNTKQISIRKNVNIIDCDNMKFNSKGEVLRYGFEHLKELDYDGYVIFDADNVVHPDFLQNMNNALNSGYRIAQGYRDSKNPSDTWISSASSLHYIILNNFFNRPRRNIDKSCFINGTGFMMSKEVIEEKGYYSETLTEDIELSVKCAIDNEKVAFVENAITFDEQVTKFGESWKQRKRWSIGTIQCLKLYVKELLFDFIVNKNFSSLDSLLFLLAPATQLLSSIVIGLHFIMNILTGVKVNYILKINFVLLVYIVETILLIILIKANKREVKKYIKGILTLPLFYFSWIPINIVALFTKNYRWERIEHNRKINLESILNIQYLKNGEG